MDARNSLSSASGNPGAHAQQGEQGRDLGKDTGATQAARLWKLSDLLPVLDALKGLRYGSVEIFVQDSKLVQIDRREKIRAFNK